MATTIPAPVRIVPVTVAARASVKEALSAVCPACTVTAAGAFRNPIVSLTVNGCSTVELAFWSSTAVTESFHLPSCSGEPSARSAFHVNVYTPGAFGPESSGRATPSGPTRLAVTVDGRTTL